MFVTAEIRVPVTEGGRAATPKTDADYACPMHPWEQTTGVGQCPICEMDTVPITSLPGYLESGEPGDILSVPREAVMKTGQRALVYVEVSPGLYRGVEIEIGPLANDKLGQSFYPIINGLTTGQSVVTRGNFVIDSQMQIAGKPSLFHARGLTTTPSHMQEAPTTQATSDKQTVCPVMVNKINPDIFVEYRGVKVFFCCPPCVEKFKADPDKYIPKLPSAVQNKIKAGTKGGHDHD
jgi:YHS domain-containing protein